MEIVALRLRYNNEKNWVCGLIPIALKFDQKAEFYTEAMPNLKDKI